MSTITEAGDDRRYPAVGPEDASAVPQAGASPWILGGWQDMLLFVGTPLLIIPLIAMLRGHLTDAVIALYVVSFGALGHHLPGMLRAYGDSELFARFRVRFVVAPLFLLAVSGFFAVRNLNGLAVLVLLWGTWHGAAQIYGFLRIYDAKVKSFAPLTAKLDMAMCIAWFGLGVLQSPERMASILRAFYDSGAPLVPASMVQLLQGTWTIATGVITIAFLANWARQTSRGCPPASAKVLLMISSFGFWWYAMTSVHNIILGVAMFEIFHDVQYLAIVWVYNVKRVEKASHVGAFTRFLFRRSWFLAGLYIGLVFAYGYIGWFGETVDSDSVKRTLLALVTASAFLHFYYDGFIWKVREKSTREGLGMSGGLSEQRAPALVPGWFKHGLKWSLFVVPVVLLGTAELRGVQAKRDRETAIVGALPNSANAHNSLGVALAAEGRLQDAMTHFRRALELNPKHDKAPNNLGGALQEMGRSKEALAHLDEALRINPMDHKAHWNRGNALRALDRREDAIANYEAALRIKPDFRVAHRELGVTLAELGRIELAKPHLTQGLPEGAANFALGNALSQFGRYEEALAYYSEVLRTDSAHARTHQKLGAALAALGRFDEAATHYREALRLRPSDAQTHIDLATSLEHLERYDDAVKHWTSALELIPDNVGIINNLAWLLATCPADRIRDGQQAVDLAETAARLSEHKNPLVLGTLAASQAEVGNFAEAVIRQQQALQLAPSERKDEFGQRLELYKSGKPFRQGNK